MPLELESYSLPARFRFVALLVWAAGLIYLLWPSFLWQIEYFKSPGPAAYYGILILAPVLVLASLLYSRLRGSRTIPWEPIVIGAPLLVLVLRHPWAAVCALLLCASSLALGRFVLVQLGLMDTRSGDEWALALLTGVSVWAWSLSMIGLAGFLYRPLFWAAAAIPAVAAAKLLPKAWSFVRSVPRSWAADPEVQRPLTGILIPFLALALLSGVLLAAAPPIINDAVIFHLPLAQKWAQTGSLTPSFDHPYSFYPQAFEVLMAWSYTLGGAQAAQTFCFTLSLLGLALCFQIVRLLGGSRQAAAAAGAIVASAPFLSWTASALKNDWLLASLQIGAAICFLRWRTDRNVRWILLGSWFLGSSFGVKHSALFAAVGLGLLVVYALWQMRRRAVVIAAIALILVSTATVWHVRAYWLAGDPGYPTGASLAARALTRPPESARNPLLRIALFLRAVHGNNSVFVFELPLPAPAGILFTFLIPLTFFGPRDRWSGNRRAIGWAVAVSLAYWIMISANLRYAITPLLLLVCVSAAALTRVHAASPPATRSLLSGFVAYGLLFGWTGSLIIKNSAPQIRYVAGLMSADDYIATVHPSLPALRRLGQLASPEDRILAVGCCDPFYYPVSWKLDCNYGGDPRRREERNREMFARTSYRFFVESAGAAPRSLPPNEVVYEDRACTIRRFLPQDAAGQGAPAR